MPRPDEQEPAETTEGWRGVTYIHPAFGQVTISRVHDSSGAVLYGTDFRHHTYVMITVHRSQLTRDLSHDWPFATEELVRFYMSEAQWAAFVSSISLGEGVQCTFAHVMREQAPAIPYRDVGQQYKAEADEKLTHALDALRSLQAEMETELAHVPKSVRERLLAKVKNAVSDLAVNLPFVSRSFAEHMEERAVKAKMEVSAYLTQLLARTGLAALRDQAKVVDVNPGVNKPRPKLDGRT